MKEEEQVTEKANCNNTTEKTVDLSMSRDEMSKFNEIIMKIKN